MISKKGFTLIELLVVVAIIGILSAVGTIAYQGYTARSKDAVLKSNHDLVLKFLITKSMECEMGNDQIKFKDASGNYVNYSCSSKDKSDFANKAQAHVNNHICKNIYRKDVVVNSEFKSSMLKQAANHNSDYIKVPKILNKN